MKVAVVMVVMMMVWVGHLIERTAGKTGRRHRHMPTAFLSHK